MIDINIDSAAENFDVIFDSCVKSDSINEANVDVIDKN